MNKVLMQSSSNVITDILDSLSGNEMKLLLVMARYSRDNIVNMFSDEKKILESCGISYKTFTKQRAVLVDKKVLCLTGTVKVYFIDPSFLIAGNSSNIYKTSAAIESGSRYWHEEAMDRKAIRDRAIEASSSDAALKKHFDKKRDIQNDMSPDEIYETVGD